MMIPLASAAFQTAYSLRQGHVAAVDDSGRPRKIDSCYAYGQGQHLARFGLPCAPIQTTAELYHHEQTQALGILAKPSDDEIALVGMPLLFDGQRPPAMDPAPDIGQDNVLLQRLLG